MTKKTTLRRVFPLDWPTDQARTPKPEPLRPAGAKDTLTSASVRIERALNLTGFADVVLSTNVPIGREGHYVSETARDGATAAALAFTFKGRPYHVGQDYWGQVSDNAWSLALMCEGLRQTVRHAGDALFERMIAGLAALPAPGSTTMPARAPHLVLGVAPDAPRAVVEAAYRALAREAHPDRGGSPARMAELTAARDALLRSGG